MTLVGVKKQPLQGTFDITQGLRDFIASLESEGQLLRVNEEVNWKYQIGEMTKRAWKSQQLCPALLFQNIKEYPEHRLLTNGLTTFSKISMALSLDPKTPFPKLVRTFKERFSNPVEPTLVSRGIATENILVGETVDLTRLPAPWWSREDGGRYIGTWHLNITKDPETRIRNVGIYRMQLLGPKRTTLSISPKSHLALQIAKAEGQGEPLEMAVAIGVDETLIMSAAAAPPYGVDEFTIAGGLAQKPVELARCHTVDLEVPASTEIVLEGKILPGQRIQDGPFLDYSGIPKTDPFAYVFEVTGFMFRDNPIFRGAVIGIPGGEDHILFSLLSSSGFLDFHGSRLRRRAQNLLLKTRRFSAFQVIGRGKYFLTLRN